jgi:hypothetical protein
VTPTDDPPAATHARPEGASDETVAAVGKLSEAYEYVIRARGHLYSFHQLMGRGDLLFTEAVSQLRDAGHGELADRLERELVGRNAIDGRWTFQIVEEYDDLYFDRATELEREVRTALMDGRRHVFESELKDDEITEGEPGHERRPSTAHDGRIDTGDDPAP